MFNNYLMLDEPHYPSKWTAALVLLVIVLMIGGIFAWAFWFNTGTITFTSRQSFTVEVNGGTIDCSNKQCSTTLPPKSYPIIAHSQGSYDETFNVQLDRWSQLKKEITFRVIPYLKAISTADVPPVPMQKVHFSTSGSLVRDQDDGEVLITKFESLKDPLVQAVGDLAVVTDQGHVFFVTISDGRKVRRFDDSVIIRQALISDNGKKILFFVKSKGVDQLWLWFNDTQELTPLTWYAEPAMVQWESGVDYRLFVISDALMPTVQTSVLDKVLTSVDVAKQKKLLLQVNLDTAEIVQLSAFDDNKTPLSLQRRGDQYLVEYADGNFDELVVK